MRTGNTYVTTDVAVLSDDRCWRRVGSERLRRDLFRVEWEGETHSTQHRSDEVPTSSAHHRQERAKPVSPSVAVATGGGPSTHPPHHARVHAKLPHAVVSESDASSPDFRRGNSKTASKRRREYRSKKQVQEVHHSGLDRRPVADKQLEGLAVASIARDVVVEMTPPRDEHAR